MNNGYTATTTFNFRIPSQDIGTLLVDVLARGVTNVDRYYALQTTTHRLRVSSFCFHSVTHVPSESALEVGRRKAIEIAAKRVSFLSGIAPVRVSQRMIR